MTFLISFQDFIFDDLKNRNSDEAEGEVSQKYYILDQVLGTYVLKKLR